MDTTENMPAGGNSTILTSDYEKVQQMYQAQNLTRGIAPVQAQTEEQIKAQQQKKAPGPRTFYIPSNFFTEFSEVNADNEEFFSYISFYLVMQMIEQITDLNWVVQFPFNIPSGGRSVIHDVATHFGLTSHSQGAKKRCALVYPKNLYKDKQEAEYAKKEKEFAKLQEKTKNIILNDNPKTIRDKMIALIGEQQKKYPDQARIKQLHGEIFYSLEHVPAEFEDYKVWVKPIIEAKQQELARSVFAQQIAAPELGSLKTEEEGKEGEEEKKEGEDGAEATTKKKKKKSKKKPAQTDAPAVPEEEKKEEKKEEKPVPPP